MKTQHLIILAASLLIPAFAAAQTPAPAEQTAQEKGKVEAATKQDIKEQGDEISSDEGKLKASHDGEKVSMDGLARNEKSDVAAAKGDKSLNAKQKKKKIAGIRKNKKAQRQAVGDQSRADRKPIEKDVRLDKASIKDDNQMLVNAAAKP